MKCPFCLDGFFENQKYYPIENDKEGHWGIVGDICPNCDRLILKLVKNHEGFIRKDNKRLIQGSVSEILIKPKSPNRSTLSAEVPSDFAEDYQKACLVLVDSPKASAALSRRCLQHILREKIGIKKRNLAEEIQHALNIKSLPTHISESLDAVRHIGNFASHPMKSTSTSEIVPVEPLEAEWNLDVI